MDTKQFLGEFCRAEMQLKKRASQFHDACVPHNVKRSRCQEMMRRIMMEDDVEWIKLDDNAYLRYRTTYPLAALSQDNVQSAVKAALQEFLTTFDSSENDEIHPVFMEILRNQIRTHRRNAKTNVTLEKKLTRGTDPARVAMADETIARTAADWVNAKTKLQQIREHYTEVTQNLHEQRDRALQGGAAQFMKQTEGNDQLVSVSGCEDRMKLHFSVSKRKKPIREIHLQDALAGAVASFFPDNPDDVELLKDRGSIKHITDNLCNSILHRATELAGVDEKDTFSLQCVRGRKCD